MPDETAARYQWLVDRQQVIGATDITRILGIAPASYGGQTRVWREKLFPIDSAEAQVNPLFYWGHKLEPVIADAYADHAETEVVKFDTDYITPWKHPDFQHVGCSPDYYVNPTGNLVEPAQYPLIECKNVTSFMADEWGASGEPAEEACPPHIVMQVQWQMGCVQSKHPAFICALIGGHDWRTYEVQPNHEWFYEAATQAEAWFIKYVTKNVAPPPDRRSDVVIGDLQEHGKILVADDHLEQVLLQRSEKKYAAKVLATELDTLDAEICMAMGSVFDQLRLRSGTRAATYKANKNGKRRLLVKDLS